MTTQNCSHFYRYVQDDGNHQEAYYNSNNAIQSNNTSFYRIKPNITISLFIFYNTVNNT